MGFKDFASEAIPMLAAIADGVLFNIPSNVLLEDIQRDYNISLAKANQLYNQLVRIYSQSEEELQKIRDKKYSLQSLIYMYPSMGAITESIRREYGEALQSEKKAQEAVSSAKEELGKAEDALTMKQAETVDPKNEARKFFKKVTGW